MYTCMCIYMLIYMQIYMYTHICMYTYSSLHTGQILRGHAGRAVGVALYASLSARKDCRQLWRKPLAARVVTHLNAREKGLI